MAPAIRLSPQHQPESFPFCGALVAHEGRIPAVAVASEVPRDLRRRDSINNLNLRLGLLPSCLCAFAPQRERRERQKQRQLQWPRQTLSQRAMRLYTSKAKATPTAAEHFTFQSTLHREFLWEWLIIGLIRLPVLAGEDGRQYILIFYYPRRCLARHSPHKEIGCGSWPRQKLFGCSGKSKSSSLKLEFWNYQQLRG
jgi:hypothetical protein